MKWWGRYGNCLFYALALWARRGGWLTMQRSPSNRLTSRWGHMGPEGNLLVLTTFVPLKPRKGLAGLVHKIWFRGKFRRTYYARKQR